MRAIDRRALVRAISLAAGGQPRVSPNPAVGCVLVQGSTTVGEGVTEPPPGRHAEVVALAAAGMAARGATAVVTLEPCAHHGRTPPCTEALLAAGVARVVIAHPDPHRVAAGGAVRLAEGGVEVVGPLPPDALLRGTVAAQLEGFLTVVATGRPHVTLKVAVTADGRVDPPEGHRWVTGPPARHAVHRWRSSVDGVLVGSGTVLADDPRLDVREVVARSQPAPVVLDGRLRTPPTAKVVRPGAVVVTVDAALGPGRERARRDRRSGRLLDAGVRIVHVPPGPDGAGVCLPAALTALGELGIVSMLAEPGPTLSVALLREGLVDRLVRHVAVHLGDGTPDALVPPPPRGAWSLERSGGAGADAIVHYQRTSVTGPTHPNASIPDA